MVRLLLLEIKKIQSPSLIPERARKSQRNNSITKLTKQDGITVVICFSLPMVKELCQSSSKYYRQSIKMKILNVVAFFVPLSLEINFNELLGNATGLFRIYLICQKMMKLEIIRFTFLMHIHMLYARNLLLVT